RKVLQGVWNLYQVRSNHCNFYYNPCFSLLCFITCIKLICACTNELVFRPFYSSFSLAPPSVSFFFQSFPLSGLLDSPFGTSFSVIVFDAFLSWIKLSTWS